MMRNNYRRYDDNFKRGIAQLCASTNYTPIQLGRIFNVSPSNIYYWMDQYGLHEQRGIKIELNDCSQEKCDKQSELERELSRIDRELETMRKEREEIVSFFGNLFGTQKE